MHLSSCIRFMVPNHALRSFPPSYVPSPGPARTAALRPQFAFEAPKCDFFGFQNSSHFWLTFLIEKMTKIINFGLPKPSQNPLQTPPKWSFQKRCKFLTIFPKNDLYCTSADVSSVPIKLMFC